MKLIYWDGTGVCLFTSGARMASFGGRVCKMERCGYRRRSCQPCWKDSIGSEFSSARGTGADAAERGDGAMVQNMSSVPPFV